MSSTLEDVRIGGLRPIRKLSERQREILRWLVLGKTNSEIAEIMDLKPGTVKSYIERLVRYYGINCGHSRVMLAVFALARGDLDPNVLDMVTGAAEAQR